MSVIPVSSQHSRAFAAAELRALLVSGLADALKKDAASIDTSRDFSEYGLDSVDAVLASGALSEKLKLDLPPELFLLHRTVDAVAEYILARRESPVATKVFGAPVILVPAGANNGRLPRLASRCNGDIAFELASLGTWKEWAEKNWIFEDLVERICNQIQSRYPAGPLRLTGFSQGGQLAFATALSLLKKGRSIETLILLDTYAVAPQVPRPSLRPIRIAWMLRSAIKRRLGIGLSKRHSEKSGQLRLGVVLWLLKAVGDIKPGYRLLLQLDRLFPSFFRGHGGAFTKNLLQLKLVNRMWSDWYESGGKNSRLQAPVVLLRSEDPGATDRGWGDLCPELRIVPVGGNHFTMFDQSHIGDLAAKFSAELDRPKR